MTRKYIITPAVIELVEALYDEGYEGTAELTRSYPSGIALKSGLSEMYPDATEEEIRKCITRMAQMVERNSDSEEDEDV